MLSKLLSNISNISINKITTDVFRDKDVQEFIISLNRDGQLFIRGVGVDNEIVGFYSFATELISKGRKKFNTKYNFKDTGEMFRSFRVKVEKDGFVIEADAEKLVDSNIIENENEILGLTNESKIELVKKITPLLIEEVRKQALK
jgi:hypothetical protein